MPQKAQSMNNQKEIIEQFKKSVSKIWFQDGQNTWPIDLNSITHLFMDLFADELFADILQLKNRGVDDSTIADRFKTAARIIRLIMPCVLGMKRSRMSVDNVRENVLYLLTLVKNLKYGDLFNRDGKNLVLSPAGFQQTVDEAKMSVPDRKHSLLVHKLCAVLWNYAESVCFKTHGLIREFHGPYRLPHSRDEILIRDFICLNPSELWVEGKAVPYQNIRVVTAYQDLGISIDIYDNIATKQEKNYIGSLVSYYIEVDGKTLDMEEINCLSRELSEIMISITTRVEGLDWKQLAKKYAEIFWYSKKELKDGNDWSPPVTVHERIEKGELNTKLQNLNPRALQRMLRISF
jgi:hypothetical protein